MSSFRFHIVTFGCKVNQYESHAIREAWQKRGGMETSEPQDADYILVNSCAITGRAERNARNALNRLAALAPNATLILSGCAAQFYDAFTPRKNAHWTKPQICISQTDKMALLGGPENTAAKPEYSIATYNRGRPVIKIQDGCSHGCAYCIVPQTRGKPLSRAPGDILAECDRLASAGYGELVISGINLRQYSCCGGFWGLLSFLDHELAAKFGTRTRLRLSSLDPAMLNEEGIKTLAGCKTICPHLHLSLQHASPDVLKAMKRSHYDVNRLHEAIAAIGWPMMGLGADFITGFPGETADDLDKLLVFIDSFPLTYAHVFPFAKRQGTVAASMSGQIPGREKIMRAKKVREAVAQKQKKFRAKQLGLSEMVIAPDAGHGGAVKGVNEFYVPCLLPAGDYPAGLISARPERLSADGIIVEPGKPGSGESADKAAKA